MWYVLDVDGGIRLWSFERRVAGMPCASTDYAGPRATSTPWFNWSGLAGGPVAEFHLPTSRADIVAIVQGAESAGRRVRAVGSGWAFEDVAFSPDVMVSLELLDGVLDYVTDDKAGALLPPSLSSGRRLVHVEGGIKIAKLNDELAEPGGGDAHPRWRERSVTGRRAVDVDAWRRF